MAARQLRVTNQTISEIGEEVGYLSDSSFSRAFKRLA
jgi:AraC-like DNA-binding protein